MKVKIVGRVKPAPPASQAPEQRGFHPPYKIAQTNV